VQLSDRRLPMPSLTQVRPLLHNEALNWFLEPGPTSKHSCHPSCNTDDAANNAVCKLAQPAVILGQHRMGNFQQGSRSVAVRFVLSFSASMWHPIVVHLSSFYGRRIFENINEEHSIRFIFIKVGIKSDRFEFGFVPT
jgi:hypothetical protein